MIRPTFAAIALLAGSSLSAQSAQDALDTRYDRALAAGYKALMLCSGLGHAAGLYRTADSIERYELAGIQGPLNDIVPTLTYHIENGSSPGLDYVTVDWADDMPPRIAHYRESVGCTLLPIGHAKPDREEEQPTRIDRVGDATVYPLNERIDARVNAATRRALDGATYGAQTRTTAVLVRQGNVTRGKGFAAGFDQNLPQRTWSVAKSLAATLVGAAVQRGEVQVTDLAGLGAGENDPRAAITIDHLLRMASGRYSDTPGNRTDPLYWGGSTVAETALGWPLIHQPGTVYRYANNDTLAAVMAIRSSFDEQPPADLFGKLGMHQTVAETDWRGDYILSSQVWTTSADLARFGQLYLDDGVWRGERVLPEGWVRYVSAPAGPQPDGNQGWGYGAGFWLFNDHAGIPADTFFAAGNRGQYVVIVPSRDVVIVRRGEDPVGTRFDIEAFTRDVLATLD